MGTLAKLEHIKNCYIMGLISIHDYYKLVEDLLYGSGNAPELLEMETVSEELP